MILETDCFQLGLSDLYSSEIFCRNTKKYLRKKKQGIKIEGREAVKACSLMRKHEEKI